MMTQLKTWLLGVVFTAFACALAGELVPKGREQALVRMVSGAFMVLALLRPLGLIEWESIHVSVGNFSQQAESYRAEQKNELSAIIADRLTTYIWDKATGLGISCEVRVTMSCAENAIPVPESVEIRAAYHPVLAAWLEEVVGIPAEKQIWLEERVWTERAESG